MTLLNHIQQQIRDQGALPFAEFMQQALYTPNLGYYTSNLAKFGQDGDFITAPELTPLFGYTLAAQCQQVLKHVTDGCILEFGAGSGRLCVDILTHLAAAECLPTHYYIMELSAHLQARQAALIAKEIPALAERVVWLTQWPTQPFNGVMLANEVLDAMPVHRFLQADGQLYESVIGLDTRGELTEKFLPCANQALHNHVATVLAKELSPYQSEANLFIPGWLAQCAQILNHGAFFILDYGFPRHEYYHSDRNQGTLMCHIRHQAHPNPLLYVGEQDITAHVDFTHVADASLAAGFHVAGYTNQASFLLANGLLSLLEDLIATLASQTLQVHAQQAVKQLLQPSEMGELFKVIALTKHLDCALTGFLLNDKRASL